MDPIVSVLILSQPDEVEVTALTLHHLIRDLGQMIGVHVLMNGGFTGELEMMSPRSSAISYHSSVTNLGVAGGRNRLLRLPEVQASDVIVILDNDVITPPGHIERLAGVVEADANAGVVGPAILYLPAVMPMLYRVGYEELRAPIAHEQLASLVPECRDEEQWFHLGTHPDWQAVYIDELELDRILIGRMGGGVEPFFSMNHRNPAIRFAVTEGSNMPIEASNVAGCCQVFRRELVDEVGYLIDEFSPYGFEDVEFCLRVAETGRRNYVVPDVLMLHGTDQRHAGRRTADGRFVTQRNLMRCKTLLAWCRAHDTWQSSIEGAVVRRYLLARQAGDRRRAVDHLRAHVAGVADGRRQIDHSTSLLEMGSTP